MNQTQPGKICKWLLEDHSICGEPASKEITVRGRIGSGKIDVCNEHYAAHNQMAAALRTSHAKK